MTASPAWRARYSSTANSRAVRATGTPARATSCVAGSTTRSPTSQAHGPLRGRAAHERAQPRQQLAEVERLGQVVVGADVEAADAVADLAARGEHEDRRPAVALAQRAADLEAVAAREHHVEDDGVVLPHRGLHERGVAVAGHVDRVALVAQPALDGPRQLRVVLDEQQPHVAPSRSATAERHQLGPLVTALQRRFLHLADPLHVPLRVEHAGLERRPFLGHQGAVLEGPEGDADRRRARRRS